MTVIFDGRSFARKKEEELKRSGKHPELLSILVGDDPASRLYVNLKKKFATRVGARMEIKEFSADTSVQKLTEFIKLANEDATINGIMIQLPLPVKIRSATKDIIDSIDANKDVDGLRDDSPFLHPTSKAIIQIIAQADVHSGVVCVVGATGMVGRPLVLDLQKRGFEVTGCDSETVNLGEKTKKADVLVSVTGVPNLIKKDMVKEGAVVIDVGSPIGDVDFEAVKGKASFITPVPGGVGPVTIACLLENLYHSI